MDRAAVGGVLDEVLAGLRSATSISKGGSVADAAAAIGRTSADFAAAGRGLTPVPTGVPDGVATPVAVRVQQLSALFHQAATCLQRQSQTKRPNPTPCLPPLRRANAKDSQLAHELITLAAYSSRSPKTFESQLVQALH